MEPPSPPVAAVFLVVFDQKVGYTIAWQRSRAEIPLDGVEFKSLPSGLHAVKEDLVYFVHGSHAGVSVFMQGEADARHRKATFVAVGALVPLDRGVLGRSWVHAEELRALAKQLVTDRADTRSLERFWMKHRSDEESPRPSAGPAGSRPGGAGTDSERAGAEATVAGLSAGAGAWPLDHPAFAVPQVVETFGPLLFPIHRAALSRQRVLFLGRPSVQRNANLVYIASLLASIPDALSERLPAHAGPILRSAPLFSIGVHDLPSLTTTTPDARGWIATTTEDILGEKKHLYDLLVRLPSSTHARTTWPTLRTADGQVVKASQRDLRRWTVLRRELRRLRRQTLTRFADASPATESDRRPPSEPRGPRPPSGQDWPDGGLPDRDESDVVEISSWQAMACRSLTWWGEASAWETDEAQADEELLLLSLDLPDLTGLCPGASGESTRGHDPECEYSRAAATWLVAYFGKLTDALLRPLARLVADADAAAEAAPPDAPIHVPAHAVRAMGLDHASDADTAVVVHLLRTWFDREALVADRGVTVCGVRIC